MMMIDTNTAVVADGSGRGSLLCGGYLLHFLGNEKKRREDPASKNCRIV